MKYILLFDTLEGVTNLKSGFKEVLVCGLSGKIFVTYNFNCIRSVHRSGASPFISYFQSHAILLHHHRWVVYAVRDHQKHMMSNAHNAFHKWNSCWNVWMYKSACLIFGLCLTHRSERGKQVHCETIVQFFSANLFSEIRWKKNEWMHCEWPKIKNPVFVFAIFFPIHFIIKIPLLLIQNFVNTFPFYLINNFCVSLCF